jgi:hypothetical protein
MLFPGRLMDVMLLVLRSNNGCALLASKPVVTTPLHVQSAQLLHFNNLSLQTIHLIVSLPSKDICLRSMPILRQSISQRPLDFLLPIHLLSPIAHTFLHFVYFGY